MPATSTLPAPNLSSLAPPPLASDDSWLGALRRAAFEFVTAQGFPTTKDEDWRYTRLTPILEVNFDAATLESGRRRAFGPVDELAGDFGGPRLVFVNGHLALDLSFVGATTDGVTLKSVAAALTEDSEVVQPHFARRSRDHHAFSALNTALAEDGAFIELAPGAVLAEPIHLVFVTSCAEGPLVVSPRSLVLAGAGAKATVIETYVGAPGEVYLDNALTEFILEEGAEIEHFKVQVESEQAFHLATLDVRQGRSSRFSTRSVALGGAIARHEVQVALEEEGAAAELSGLFMPRGTQHHDNPTTVEHVAPRCTSHEVYKGVVDDAAHGVFNGRVIVHLDAAGTDASQVNKNLLLSESAEVDTRPRLEILADDVKVSHGAAVGQLDKEALFYLRSRGIPAEEARGLLISAFVEELLEEWSPPELRERVAGLVAERIPRGVGQ